MNVNVLKAMVCACMVFGATAVFAQTDATSGATVRTSQNRAPKKIDPVKMAEHQTAHMAKELSLTDDQKAKVLEIAKKYAAQKPSKEMFAKKDAEIEAVLTAEQKTKYADFQKKVTKLRNGEGHFSKKQDEGTSTK